MLVGNFEFNSGGLGGRGGGVVKKERLEDFRSQEAGISVLNSYILILK